MLFNTFRLLRSKIFSLSQRFSKTLELWSSKAKIITFAFSLPSIILADYLGNRSYTSTYQAGFLRSRVRVLLKSAVIPAIFPFLSGPPKDGKREGRPSAAIMPSTNLFIFGLTKPTLLWLNSLDFRSSSSSSLEKNVSLGISSNSLPSLLELEPIRCKRDWTAKEAAEARGALDRAAPGHQVSRLWKKWMRKRN